MKYLDSIPTNNHGNTRKLSYFSIKMWQVMIDGYSIEMIIITKVLINVKIFLSFGHKVSDFQLSVKVSDKVL